MKNKSIVPVILSLVSMVGVGFVAYFCAKETPDAMAALDEEETKRKTEAEEKGVEPEEMTIIEKGKVVGPHYVKTCIAIAGTTVCIASGQIVSISILSGALASAYAWQHKYLDLDGAVRKEAMKLKDKLGTDIRREIKKEAISEQAKKEVATKVIKKEEHVPYKVLDDKAEFEVFEDITGHLVTVTKQRLRALNELINRRIAKGENMTGYEFLRRLGFTDKKIKECDPVHMFKHVGWDMNSEESCNAFSQNPDGFWIDIILDYIPSQDGTEDIPVMYYSIPMCELDAGRDCWLGNNV